MAINQGELLASNHHQTKRGIRTNNLTTACRLFIFSNPEGREDHNGEEDLVVAFSKAPLLFHFT
jgi:hypothetical protein